MWSPVELSAIHSTQNMTVVEGASQRPFNGVLVEMETNPCLSAHSFSSLFSGASFSLSSNLKHFHSRKSPIIEISGSCWKRDSLWNVFGVKQGHCLSCPSANRMLCAGERRKIRTDNGKRKREKKTQGRKRKQLIGWWCRDDLMAQDRIRQTGEYRITRIVWHLYRK